MLSRQRLQSSHCKCVQLTKGNNALKIRVTIMMTHQLQTIKKEKQIILKSK